MAKRGKHFQIQILSKSALPARSQAQPAASPVRLRARPSARPHKALAAAAAAAAHGAAAGQWAGGPPVFLSCDQSALVSSRLPTNGRSALGASVTFKPGAARERARSEPRPGPAAAAVRAAGRGQGGREGQRG